MGGSKERDRPANIVVMCSMLNSLIESDDRWARVAKEFGWKLESWQVPEDEPVRIGDSWFLFDNNVQKQQIDKHSE